VFTALPELTWVPAQPPLPRPADHTVTAGRAAEAHTGARPHTPTDPGCVHHLAFALSQATFAQTVERLDERGDSLSGDRAAKDPYRRPRPNEVETPDE
jgi:hypothetical protein